MKGFVYILKCKNNKFYVGSTDNLQLRIEQHFSGNGSQFTIKNKPVELVYLEEYENLLDAYQRERQLHNWSHSKKEALINNDFNMLHRLSIPHK